MPDVIEGHLSGDGHRIGIVVSRFNDFITQRLLDGALDSLRRHGVDLSEVSVAWCPGSFEIPVTAKKMAESGRFDAVICLGAVIRGATAHFDYVAGGVAGGVARSEEHTSELQSRGHLVCRLLLEKKKKDIINRR